MAEATTVQLTADQKIALEKLIAFAKDPNKKVFCLCGYAGTGKTFLIKHFAKTMDLSLHFAAYTGKAVDVLRRHGLSPCSTVHSLIYVPRQSHSTQELLELREAAERETNAEKRKELLKELSQSAKEVEFILRDPQEIDSCDILVVDEYSMVTEEVYNDLLQLFPKILFVGDLGQLPPVNDTGIRLKPDAELTEIVRQAEGSPIIQLATKVRQGIDLPMKPHPGADYLINNFNQVLCGMNRTRIKLNQGMRQVKYGLNCSLYPLPEDRIIVLRNDKKRNVYNGQQFTVVECAKKDENVLECRVKEMETPLPLLTHGFKQYLDPNIMRLLTPADYRDGVLVDYAYAITVHKAQGSQWDRVALINDMGWMRNKDFIYYSKWAYTAVTRAVEAFEAYRAR